MREEPPSELTMLFSDIEGSTRLLNRLGPAYADALATHRGILRQAFDETGGRELGTEGDSFFVVFASAADAVAAAVRGQRSLESASWPGDVRLRVRMGLHTGHPEWYEDDLVGLDVHLAARVAATAHGGQVVVSSETAERVASALPPGTSLLDLGVHRLKDIPEPQRLSQVVVPGLPSTFPPLRSLGAPGSLPSAPTALVGRERDLTAVTALLAAGGPRLVTLTGPGGTGKTRLSLAVAGAVARDHPDGVHFVDLSSATEPPVAWTTLAETLGRSGDTAAGVLEYLHDRDVLLVPDNLEQLRDSAAGFVGELVSATGRLRLLATSRRPLHVPGEQEYPVPPLGLPGGPGVPTVEEADRADAVRLFVQRARMGHPGFAVTDDNVADVVALCRRLGGLPLAIELAAARVRLLPPRALLDHLDEALALPLPGHPERHQTLMATVDWSYRMVGEAEQRAFRALAVFGSAGGTFDAVAAVVDSPSSPLAVVSGLLDAALVRVDDHPAGPRVRLLQTVQTVARGLAVREGELDALQRRHAEYYLAVAEHAGDRLRGPDAVSARGVLELEMDNLRAALDWSLGDGDRDRPDGGDGPGGRGAIGIRLCTALGWFWYLTGYGAESRRWLERASRAAAAQQGPQLARLLHTFALLLLQQGDLGPARDVLAKSLVLWRRAGDRTGEAVALNSLGVAYRALGDPGRARALLRESIEVARSVGNRPRLATALTNLALLEVDTGEPDAALPLLAEAERIDVELGNAWGVATDRVNRAVALLAASRLRDAVGLLRDLAASVTDHGDPDLTLGVVELGAVAASLSGDHARAVRLAACADEQRTLNDMPLAGPDRAFLDRHLDVSRQALGDAVGSCERDGRSLSVDQALTEAAEPATP